MAMLPVRRGGQSLTVLNPSREFEDIYNRMGQLMNMALGNFTNLETTDIPWTPLADFRETGDAYVINAELPGLKRDQIQLEVQEHELVVAGEMMQDGEGDGKRHRSSRHTGRFEYRTYLPSDIKPDKVKARLHDGILTVTVPKSEAAKPRQIQITEELPTPQNDQPGSGATRSGQTAGVAVKLDSEIRADVIGELQWDPQVTDPDAIGVAVKDGAVVLTGHAPSYAEKIAAARSAARVYGVKVVADDVKVHLSGEPRDDADVARVIAHVLESNIQIPEGRVHARVQDGWVTLDGQVSYDYQRREVERMVRHIRGVQGITNAIGVTPPVSPGVVEAQIEAAFKREAAVDARHIRVEVSDHVVTLHGHVHSLPEAAAAAAAAAAAPGVAKVESRIVVYP